jgi:ATP-binding cassette subfamily B (MDR/TAP) protein 8
MDFDLIFQQAAATFTYIYSLSIVGEGVATELRRRMFASMLNQDIVFFDTHMTGEIVSRLTADIQEFKSSFKQCVSQGLRSFSQAIGCIISLYMISPEMTKTVICIVPVIITIGSVFGRGLRSLSKRAQEQVIHFTFY